MVREAQQWEPLIFGPMDRVQLASSCDVAGSTMNTMSGTITVGPHSFVGHSVSLLTGGHDYSKRNEHRYLEIPREGRDIVIGEGVWLASNCTVLGPCRIGDHSVVAAGALVIGDVPNEVIVAGVPARVVGTVPAASGDPDRADPQAGASRSLQ
jgi:acetyltransferase-like isoleucine patch superfamily enzyme